MKSMKLMAEGLGRPVVWVAGVQKRFALPVRESYPEGYESFLRKIIHLRVLGVAEETLREFWAVERKLIEVLHLDPQSSPTWMVDACAVDADPESHKKGCCMGYYAHADCIHTKSYLFYPERKIPAWAH
jgi:hypothetical protein